MGEVLLVENKRITAKTNLDFGAMDITEQFPELKEDRVKTHFDEILDYTSGLVGKLDFKADIMVLAGGDYLYFYETVGYEMKKNTIFVDKYQPFLLEFETFDKYDKDILNKSLDEIKKRCPNNVGWWDGARGMRFCMNAIAREIDAKYIIPTKINMLMGLFHDIKEKNKIEK